jgi:hypothetical protein
MKSNKMRTLILCALSGWLATTCLSLESNARQGKQPYLLPLGAVRNTIHLSVVNGGSLKVSTLKVEPVYVPPWLRVLPNEQFLGKLASGGEATAHFTFSVNKLAPLNRQDSILFRIYTSQSESWTKSIKVMVAAPDHFELLQNYPNPFNPMTTISYLLAHDGHVNVSITNTLGQQVASLVDAYQDGGYKTVTFDASFLPSGVYFYRLKAGNFVDVKKMILMR